MKTLDDFDFKGKRVLIRVDLNSSFSLDGKLIPSERFDAHAATIEELCSKGAKVVVLAHQGRPGERDFTSLSQHAQVLASKLGRTVKFTQGDVIGPTALYSVQALNYGGVLLLDNVRLLSEENLERSAALHASSIFVSRLSHLFDVFVSDAFSNAHRKHASMLGFPAVLPSFAGRVMQSEVAALAQVSKALQRPLVYLLGGFKVEESIQLLKSKIETLDLVLTGGNLGLMFLCAKGIKLGEPTESKLAKLGMDLHLEELKELLNLHCEKIVTPLDLAVESSNFERLEYPITEFPVNLQVKDIGTKTAEKYALEILKAKTILVKGTVGEFENSKFASGTITTLKAIVETKAFTFTCGGSISTAFKNFKLDSARVGFTSLAGGALLEYLTKGNLPGVEVLEHA